MTSEYLTALVSVPALVGCSIPHPGVVVPTGRLVRHDHIDVGEVRLTDDAIGSRIHIEASGLPPGIHGIPVHAVGRFDGAGFAAAGPHWNSTHREHGHDNPAGHHSVDLGSVSVGEDGAINTDLIATDLRLVAHSGSKGFALHDRDCESLIIHASPDDERTDPSATATPAVHARCWRRPLLGSSSFAIAAFFTHGRRLSIRPP